MVGLVSGAMDDNLKAGVMAGIISRFLLLTGIALARKPKERCCNEREAVC